MNYTLTYSISIAHTLTLFDASGELKLLNARAYRWHTYTTCETRGSMPAHQIGVNSCPCDYEGVSSRESLNIYLLRFAVVNHLFLRHANVSSSWNRPGLTSKCMSNMFTIITVSFLNWQATSSRRVTVLTTVRIAVTSLSAQLIVCIHSMVDWLQKYK
jgi:hypothetical protein